MLIGKDPLKIAELGVSLSFVPEDRLGMGLVGNMDLTDNMMLRSFRDGRSPFANRKEPKALAERVVEDLEVVTPGISTPVRRLSGGNVQKVLVGREIASAPTVLLTAYAVRGLDINSSYTIYELLNEQKKKGVAVIFVGEDLDVMVELCDRIMVLCGGEVSGIVDARRTDKNEVGKLLTRVGGGEKHESCDDKTQKKRTAFSYRKKGSAALVQGSWDPGDRHSSGTGCLRNYHNDHHRHQPDQCL